MGLSRVLRGQGEKFVFYLQMAQAEGAAWVKIRFPTFNFQFNHYLCMPQNEETHNI